MNPLEKKTDDSVESIWICKNPEEVYQYEGEWIAVVGEKIVTHGEELERVINEAEKYGKPLLKFVEPAEFVIYGN